MADGEQNIGEESVTSLSLLARLKQDPQGTLGWDEFVLRYQPRIFRWCCRWGLQESDAHDVSQNVMLELSQQIGKFEYRAGGRFRSWLRTVARRAWYDYAHRKKKIELQSNNSGWWELLASERAERDLLQSLEEECDRELLHIAMRRVQARVKPATWEAFRLTELEQLPADEAARQTGITKGSVYVARGRIQKMLLQEVKLLDHMT